MTFRHPILVALFFVIPSLAIEPPKNDPFLPFYQQSPLLEEVYWEVTHPEATMADRIKRQKEKLKSVEEFIRDSEERGAKPDDLAHLKTHQREILDRIRDLEEKAKIQKEMKAQVQSKLISAGTILKGIKILREWPTVLAKCRALAAKDPTKVQVYFEFEQHVAPLAKAVSAAELYLELKRDKSIDCPQFSDAVSETIEKETMNIAEILPLFREKCSDAAIGPAKRGISAEGILQHRQPKPIPKVKAIVPRTPSGLKK